MATTPSVLDQAIARTLGSGQSAAPAQSASAVPATPPAGGDVLDGAISRALGQKAPAQPMDKSFAAAQFPELQNDPLSRTLYNMTAARSGQKLATPEDEAEGERGRKAGTIAGGLTLATGALAGPLAAPAVGAEQIPTESSIQRDRKFTDRR